MAPKKKGAASKKRAVTVRKGKTSVEQLKETPTVEPVPVQAENDSVIMVLSSVENTLINEADPSVMYLSTLEVNGRATRLTNVDMLLEDSDMILRRSSRSFAGEQTNMSLINIDQTPVIHRDRPKSSTIRQTMLPAPVDRLSIPIPVPTEEIPFRKPSERKRSSNRLVFSGEFCTITKRQQKSRIRPALVENRANISMVMEELPGEQTNIEENSAIAAFPNAKESMKEKSPVVEKEDNHLPENKKLKSAEIHSKLKINKRATNRKNQAATDDNDLLLSKENLSSTESETKKTGANKQMKSKLVEDNSPEELVLSTRPVRNKSRNRRFFTDEFETEPYGLSKNKSVKQLKEPRVQDKSKNPIQKPNAEEIVTPVAVSDKNEDEKTTLQPSVSRSRSKTKTSAIESFEELPPSKRMRTRSASRGRQPALRVQNANKVASNSDNLSSEPVSTSTRGLNRKSLQNLVSENDLHSKVSVRRRRSKKNDDQAMCTSSISSSDDCNDKENSQHSNVAQRKRSKPTPVQCNQEIITAEPVAVRNSLPEESAFVARRKRPRENTDKLIEESAQSTVTNRRQSRSKTVQKPNIEDTAHSTVTVRSRSKSVRRTQDAPKIYRTRSKSASRPVPLENSTVKPSAKRSIVNEPMGGNQTESPPKVTRRYRDRIRIVDFDKPSKPSAHRTRSQSVSRATAVVEDVPVTTKMTRSASVPRQLNESGSHIPIYRQLTTGTNSNNNQSKRKRTTSLSTNLILSPEPVIGGDIYAFDSPSQFTGDNKLTSKKQKSKPTQERSKNNSSNASSSKRKTPSKRPQHCLFGTNMKQISSVVKKIGGGPVRRKSEASEKMEALPQTATLAALVQTSKPITSGQHPPNQRSVARPENQLPPEDDHDYDDHFDAASIPPMEVPVPLSPPSVAHPSEHLPPVINRAILPRLGGPQQMGTPDRNTLNFSPIGASSPWRIQDENVLPKTFYYARSKDLLPSYESDVVIQDVAPRPKTPTQQRFVQPAAPQAASKNPDLLFQSIQKSYEQLKLTSEMSEKLITAMRNYKTSMHNQTANLRNETNRSQSEEELLFAKFREYEENMKKTYQKLRQWYERSYKTLASSMKTIEKASGVVKTQAQKQVLVNFHRDSQRFVTMISELESAMNDSNIENVSPVKSSNKAPFKEIILSERNLGNPKRSPLKTLDIVNISPRLSPIKSPLVKASFPAAQSDSLARSRDRFSRLSLVRPPSIAPPSLEPSLIEIPPQNQKKDNLFGFDCEDSPEEEQQPLVEPTPIKITKETLKERLQSVRKLLPQRPPTTSAQKTTLPLPRQQRLPNVFSSPATAQHKRLQSIQTAFTSTPLAEKRSSASLPLEAANVSAIEEPLPSTSRNQEAAPQQHRVSLGLFRDNQEPETSFTSAANRTYTRVPKRNPKRKRNIYLAGLGLSDDDEDEDEEENNNAGDAIDVDELEEVQVKKRRVATHKKKKPVEETNEFRKFVTDFNSMCEEVNRYQLVIEKPRSTEVI
ncbi:uncharacterized protein LOC129746404 [Uranotaenia lowii]|uniref:uncharacterized protein LOC129746404 n=1 Tax=Uranotaenia lowii TaxID=190385 RepID=UPI00247B21D7|nr:uncharacterized protein LOC129746404 [Uranotaenia lowii]